jgi:hypothetical protein
MERVGMMKGSALAFVACSLLAFSFCVSKKKTPPEMPVADASGPDQRIKFLNSGDRTYNHDRWNPIIANIIKSLLNQPDCVNAFDQAGIDLKQLLDRGLVNAAADALGAFSGEDLTITDSARRTGQRLVDDWHTPAFTTTNFDGMPQTVTDGRPHIFLNQRAFSGGEDYLREVLVHELIHCCRIPAQAAGTARKVDGQAGS